MPPGQCDFVFGNPPFVGAKFQSPEQRAQVRRIADLGRSGGTLDYVAAWFLRAGEYVRGGETPRETSGNRACTAASKRWALRVSGGFSVQNKSASSSARIRLWPTKTKSTSIPLRIGVASRKPRIDSGNSP